MAVEVPEKIPALVNITNLARLLGVGRTTVYEWLHTEQLPPAAKIISGRRYWTRAQIEHYLDKGFDG